MEEGSNEFLLQILDELPKSTEGEPDGNSPGVDHPRRHRKGPTAIGPTITKEGGTHGENRRDSRSLPSWLRSGLNPCSLGLQPPPVFPLSLQQLDRNRTIHPCKLRT